MIGSRAHLGSRSPFGLLRNCSLERPIDLTDRERNTRRMPRRILVTLIGIYATASVVFFVFMSAPAVAPCMGLGDNSACGAQWQASRSAVEGVLVSTILAIGVFAIPTALTLWLRRPPPRGYVGPRPRLPRFRMSTRSWIVATVGYAVLAFAVYVFGSTQVAPCLGGQLGDPRHLCATAYFEQPLTRFLNSPLPAVGVFVLLLFVTARLTRSRPR